MLKVYIPGSFRELGECYTFSLETSVNSDYRSELSESARVYQLISIYREVIEESQ